MGGEDPKGAGGLYPSPATPAEAGAPADYPPPLPGTYYPAAPSAPTAAAGVPAGAQVARPPRAAGVAAPPPTHQRPLPAVWTTRSEVVTCPGCGALVKSRVTVNDCTMGNWLFCCLTGACCVFIPGICNCASNAYHRCPNCGYMLGGLDRC